MRLLSPARRGQYPAYQILSVRGCRPRQGDASPGQHSCVESQVRRYNITNILLQGGLKAVHRYGAVNKIHAHSITVINVQPLNHLHIYKC